MNGGRTIAYFSIYPFLRSRIFADRIYRVRMNGAPRSKLRGILSEIAPKPYPPSLSRATARSPRHSSLQSRQSGTEYPGEGE